VSCLSACLPELDRLQSGNAQADRTLDQGPGQALIRHPESIHIRIPGFRLGGRNDERGRFRMSPTYYLQRQAYQTLPRLDPGSNMTITGIFGRIFKKASCRYDISYQIPFKRILCNDIIAIWYQGTAIHAPFPDFIGQCLCCIRIACGNHASILGSGERV